MSMRNRATRLRNFADAGAQFQRRCCSIPAAEALNFNAVCKKTSKSAHGERRTEFTQRLKLQKQNSNDEDYLYMLSTNGIITENSHKPSNYGNRRIAKAYRYFVKLIDEKKD